MRLLVVRLSSMGDVVRAMPVVADMRAAFPQAAIDWLVEPHLAPLVRRVEGVSEVIAAPLRRGAWWTPAARRELSQLRARLAHAPYDAVLDLQGMARSALLARLAKCVPGGHRYGFAAGGDGVEWQAAARWLVDRAVRVPRRLHAVERMRRLAAPALGRAPEGPPRYGLRSQPHPTGHDAPTVALLHGASREARLWPQQHWVHLGRRLLDAGYRIALPHFGEAEQTRAEMIAASLQFERAPQVEVWPSISLEALIDRLAGVQGSIGVAGGPSALAVALGLPHVEIHTAATAWLTGPVAASGSRQLAVEGVAGRPLPAPEHVEAAWEQVRPALPARRKSDEY